jgi:hypothetical protein
MESGAGPGMDGGAEVEDDNLNAFSNAIKNIRDGLIGCLYLMSKAHTHTQTYNYT